MGHMGSLLELPRYARQHLLVFCCRHAAFAMRWPPAEEGVLGLFSSAVHLLESAAESHASSIPLRSALRSLLLLSPNE